MPTRTSFSTSIPAASAIRPAKQPGHWLLASLGKRVLRPGGLELTRKLMERLAPHPEDDVVEFAPGLGVTAQMTLARSPRSYVGVEREESVVRRLERTLGAPHVHFRHSSAEMKGLGNACASLVYGEAMLSMQTPEQKSRILAEAFRILRPGGRYGIHELALRPDDIDDRTRKAIEREMSLNIHVGVRPITLREWKDVLEAAGFEVEWCTLAPMHLLEPKRMIQDEGIVRALWIGFNLLRKPEARKRVLSMRHMFRQNAESLTAVALVARKPHSRS
jgi:SAM-dependent methyltransferase